MNQRSVLGRAGFVASLFVFLPCLLSLGTAEKLPAEETLSEKTSGDVTPVSFAKQIEPIFRRNCYGCHQGAKQLGSYLMTDFASMVNGGETGDPAIVPGNPESSYLISQITAVDGNAEMPKPPAKPISEMEVELVRRWIAEGATDDSPIDSGSQYSSEDPPRYNEAPSIPSIDVSPDGKQIAVAGYHEVLLFDAAQGTLQRRLVGMSPRLNSVSYCPDGTRLAAVGGTPGVEGEVQIWNPGSGELELSVAFTYDALSGAGWSPDSGKLAFGASDNVVRAIDTKTGQQVLFQGAHDDWIRDVAFTPDGKHLVSVGRDMSCKLTEVETERFVDNITSITPGALSGGLSSVAMHPKRNEIVFGGADGVAKVYRIFRETARKIGDDANLIRKMPEMKGRIFRVAINHDATRIAAAATLNGKSEIRVWTYDFDGTLTDELKKILAKRVAERSADDNKKVAEYRKSETKQLASCKIDDAAYAITFAPDDSLVIAASDGKIRRLSESGDLTESFDLVKPTETAEAIAGGFDAGVWTESLEIPARDQIDVKSIRSINVFPKSTRLSSPYAYTQLVVTGTTTAGDMIDVTGACSFETPDFAIATDSGLICPTGDGEGDVVVRLGPHHDELKIAADRINADSSNSIGAVDFIQDVNPILSRLGCNQGT